MKATELMIGDWILYGDKPVKVLQLSENSKYDWVKPIPLTPEMLEKNGFEMFKYDGWVHYYRIFGNSAIPFVLHSMIGGEMLSQEVGIFSTSTDTNCGIEVNYVHELQHALRLCRLNKLAENFKV